MKKLFTISIIALASVSAIGQSLKVSTGSANNTYSRVFKEMSSACFNEIQMTEVNSTGSTQNIDRIIGNEVHMSMSQVDVLFYRARTEDLSKIKTLVSLFPEEVHVVALTNSNIKEGGTLGFGAKQLTFNTVNDLANRTVVAVGGSYITAQVIRLQSEIPFNVVEVNKNEDALAALNAGTAQAAIFVGGSPLGVVSALNKSYKLLSFPEATIAKLKNVYKPARVTYSNMGVSGVQTISTDALMVTREYTTPKMVTALSQLRKCIYDHVPELSETVGMSSAWSKIDVTNQGKWSYMTLPTTKK